MGVAAGIKKGAGRQFFVSKKTVLKSCVFLAVAHVFCTSLLSYSGGDGRESGGAVKGVPREEFLFDHGINHGSAMMQQKGGGGEVREEVETSLFDWFNGPSLDFLGLLGGSVQEDKPLSNYQLGKKLYKRLRFDTSFNWFDTYELHKDLLTVKTGKARGTKLSSVNDIEIYDNDPRLVWSIYLDHLLNLKDSNSDYNDLVLPFHWYDWADFHDYNKILSLNHTNIQCAFFFDAAFEIEKLRNIEDEIEGELFIKDRNKYNEANWYRRERGMAETHIFSVLGKHCEINKNYNKGKFQSQLIVKETYDKLRPEVYQFQARNYVYNSLYHPLSISILNHDDNVFRFQLAKREDSKNMLQSNLLQDFIERNIKNFFFSSKLQRENGKKDSKLVSSEQQRSKIDETNLSKNSDENEINIYNAKFYYDEIEPSTYDFKNNQSAYDFTFNHADIFEKFVKSDIAKKHIVEVEGGYPHAHDNDYFKLSEDDFKFNPKEKIEELESNLENLNNHEKSYLQSLKFSFNTHPAFAPKYFNEASNVKSFNGQGWHLDKRFFNGDQLADTQKYAQKMNSMIRTYQKFIKSTGLVSWIAHGTSYGHLYNGMTFPWDNDFDVQMPIKHLNLMAQYFNQSLVVDDPRDGNGRYLIDMTSSITTRTNANGYNNIDARFIDIDSGLYIDITGLAATDSPIKNYLSKYFDQNYPKIKEGIENNSTKLHRVIPDEGMAALDLPTLKELVDKKFDRHSEEQKGVEEMSRRIQRGLDRSDREKNFTSVQRFTINNMLKIYNCRNSHFSTFDDISELEVAYFHGVKTFVPKNFVKIMKGEYSLPDRYGYTVYKDQTYVPELRVWLRSDILRKCGSMYSWYPSVQKLGSSLTELVLPDIKLLYFNFVKAGYHELLGTLYNSFNQTTFRMKEMEIKYDKKLKLETKNELVHKLKSEVAPVLNNPGKDPYLFDYEKRLWDQVSSTFSNETLNKIHNEVSTEILKDLWSWTETLYKKDVDFFKIESPATNSTLNLNEFGMNLLQNNKTAYSHIFKKQWFEL